MFIILVKITMQKELTAEHCFTMFASVLCIRHATSAPLKMLIANENVNSVRTRLTKLKYCYSRTQNLSNTSARAIRIYSCVQNKKQ